MTGAGRLGSGVMLKCDTWSIREYERTRGEAGNRDGVKPEEERGGLQRVVRGGRQEMRGVQPAKHDERPRCRVGMLKAGGQGALREMRGGRGRTKRKVRRAPPGRRMTFMGRAGGRLRGAVEPIRGGRATEARAFGGRRFPQSPGRRTAVQRARRQRGLLWAGEKTCG